MYATTAITKTTIAVLPNVGDEDACFLISGFTGLRESKGLLSLWDGVETSIASCRPMEWQEEESGNTGVPRRS